MPYRFNPLSHRFDLVEVTSGSGFIASLTGNSGGSVGPDGSDNINIVGSGPITVTGDSMTNTLTIGSVFPFLTWYVITGNQMASTQEGYFVDGVATVEVTLPIASSVGDTFSVCAKNANGWKILQDVGQQIFIGNQSTTVGATGYLESTMIGDSITLVCSVANTEWFAAIGFVGNITVV